MKSFLFTLLIAKLSLISFSGCQKATNDTKSDQPESTSGFFPITVWWQPTTVAAKYKNAGINVYITAEVLTANTLNNLRANNMKVICYQNDFGLQNLKDTLIFGWLQQDEPDNAQWNAVTKKYDPCIDPAIIIANYNKIKQNDPNRPVYLNLGQGVSFINYNGRGACKGNVELYKSAFGGYLKGCDIGSFDIYPVNSSYPEVQNNLWYVANGMDNLYNWSERTKPMWCNIETTQFGSNSPRKPTISEVKSEVWMALIHGAKGISYFAHVISPIFDETALLKDDTMMEALKNINMQIASLATILNSQNTSGFASLTSSNASIPVDIMTKNYKGIDYIFAVAMRPGETTATFTISSGTAVEVIGENRKISVVSGKFMDDYTAYGVHLYKIIK